MQPCRGMAVSLGFNTPGQVEPDTQLLCVPAPPPPIAAFRSYWLDRKSSSFMICSFPGSFSGAFRPCVFPRRPAMMPSLTHGSMGNCPFILMEQLHNWCCFLCRKRSELTLSAPAGGFENNCFCDSLCFCPWYICFFEVRSLSWNWSLFKNKGRKGRLSFI